MCVRSAGHRTKALTTHRSIDPTQPARHGPINQWERVPTATNIAGKRCPSRGVVWCGASATAAGDGSPTEVKGWRHRCSLSRSESLRIQDSHGRASTAPRGPRPPSHPLNQSLEFDCPSPMRPPEFAGDSPRAPNKGAPMRQSLYRSIHTPLLTPPPTARHYTGRQGPQPKPPWRSRRSTRTTCTRTRPCSSPSSSCWVRPPPAPWPRRPPRRPLR